MAKLQYETYTEQDYIDDTNAHISLVQAYIASITRTLNQRALVHDASKFEEPEKSIFHRNTLAMRACAYGSEDYMNHLEKVKPALEHHYKHNAHHAEHHPNGIRDMDLVDITEMFCDWTASAEKHKNGDIIRSIRVNQERFGYSDELAQVLINTVSHLGIKQTIPD